MIQLKTPAQVTPCFAEDQDERKELQRLFSSSDVFDHLEARELCNACPFKVGCFELALETKRELGWAGAPEGTWGGVLWRRGVPLQPRGRKRLRRLVAVKA